MALGAAELILPTAAPGGTRPLRGGPECYPLALAWILSAVEVFATGTSIGRYYA